MPETSKKFLIAAQQKLKLTLTSFDLIIIKTCIKAFAGNRDFLVEILGNRLNVLERGRAIPQLFGVQQLSPQPCKPSRLNPVLPSKPLSSFTSFLFVRFLQSALPTLNAQRASCRLTMSAASLSSPGSHAQSPNSLPGSSKTDCSRRFRKAQNVVCYLRSLRSLRSKA